MAIVKTYNGRDEKREDCVFIRGKYYHKERDCYFYNGIYYSPFSRYLVLDEENLRRVHILAEKLQYGLVGLNGNIPRFGYYSANIANNGKVFIPETIEDEVLEEATKSSLSEIEAGSALEGLISEDPGIRRGSRAPLRTSIDDNPFTPQVESQPPLVKKSIKRVYPCMNVWPLLESGFVASKSSDTVAKPDDIKSCERTLGVRFGHKTAAMQYDFNLAYNSEVMMDLFQKTYDQTNFVSDNKTRLKALASILGDRTFGIEYEAWDGRLNTFLCAKSGLIPLRDGSLRHDNICGYEYATVIMQGEKGLNAIKQQCNLLNDYTVFNERCSMHIHVGNIPRTKDNLERIFKAFQTIQLSLYEMFPACLMDTSVYKQKAYCSPLPSIPSSADHIVNFLSDGTEKFQAFGKPHPRDNSGQSKWAIHSRYSIVNLNGFYYTSRGTVELRISTPTYNYNKVAALLVIFTAIINEAIAGRIYSTVEGLLNGPAFSEIPKSAKTWLSNYVKHRVRVLSAYTPISGGVKYFEDYKNDNTTGNEESLY